MQGESNHDSRSLKWESNRIQIEPQIRSRSGSRVADGAQVEAMRPTDPREASIGRPNFPRGRQSTPQGRQSGTHRAPKGWLERPERVDFFMLLLVLKGQTTHTVDFVDWRLLPGSLVFVRPGQVQQWHQSDGLQAQLILIDPSTLPHRSQLMPYSDLRRLDLDHWPTCISLPPPARRITARWGWAASRLIARRARLDRGADESTVLR